MQNLDHDYLCLIGIKIADKRRSRGEKMTTVAKAIGVTHGLISLIENGRYNSLKITTLIKLAEYLKIPLHELLQRNEREGEPRET